MSTYNGWKNWATWNVALWVGNEEPLYREMRATVRRHRGRFTGNDAQTLAEELFPDHRTPDMDGTEKPGERWRDIHWPEIAAAWREERD